jgi:hypothetical protein
MAGGDEMLGLSGAAGLGAALLFMGAGTNVYDAFSAVMSSPWSTEKFTQSPEEEKMAREYVNHALVISWIYAGGGALLAARSGGIKLAVWPLVGAGLVTVYMKWLYARALAGSAIGDSTPDDDDTPSTSTTVPARAQTPISQGINGYVWGGQ